MVTRKGDRESSGGPSPHPRTSIRGPSGNGVSSSSWSGHGSAQPSASEATSRPSLEAARRTRLRFARTESRCSDEEMGWARSKLMSLEVQGGVELGRWEIHVTIVRVETLQPQVWASKTTGVMRIPLRWHLAATLWTCLFRRPVFSVCGCRPASRKGCCFVEDVGQRRLQKHTATGPQRGPGRGRAGAPCALWEEEDAEAEAVLQCRAEGRVPSRKW